MHIFRKKRNVIPLLIGALLLGFISTTVYGLSVRNKTFTKAAETASPSIFNIDPSFSSSMVLQRGQIIDIWGTGTPRTQFKVTFANKSINSVVDTYGRWKISFPPMAAGGPYQLTISGGAGAILTDVWIGDVFLCSGQSNMQFRLLSSTDGATSVNRILSEHLNMRLLRLPATPKFALGVLPVIPHKWAFPSVSTLNPFSAVCALTGEKLARQLNIPIGLIESAVGGTPIESWISYANLLTYPNAVSLLSNLQNAKSFETVLPPEVRSCMDVQTANVLYDGMINPLKVHSVKGVLWYQGEGNTPRAFEYQYLLPLLVKSFRDHFNNPTLPFFVVQLPNFADGVHWEELRWVQQDAANHLANVYTIPTLDLGESHNIHPLNKAPIAQRLYAQIMNHLYGSGIVATGPVFASAQINGPDVHVYFSLKGVGGGLVAKGGGSHIGGFTLAGSDGMFYPAQASISAANIVNVTSTTVPAPLYVRYGWSQDTSDANLMSVKDWPVFPFRTDTQPFATVSRSLADRPLCPTSVLNDTFLDMLPQ